MPSSAKTQAKPVDTEDNLASALDLAGRGFKVFPITKKVHGAWTPIRSWQNLMSADSATIRGWWCRWPDARVGLPTGACNGIAALDIDEKHGASGSATLAGLGFRDIERMTPVRVQTPSGGWHLFFKHDHRLINAIGDRGRGIGRALDIRAAGAFVVAPGSHKDGRRYHPLGAPLGSVELPAWPEALLPRPEPERAPVEVTAQPTDAQLAWAKRHLAVIAETLAGLREGNRNDELNRAAMWAGGAAAHGFLTRELAEEMLIDAAMTAGLGRREAETTFDSGFSAGLANPISDFPRAVIAEDLLDDEPGEPAAHGDDDSNEPVPAAAPQCRIESIEEATAGTGREYQIKGFLSRGDLACIFGQPGAGKSLIAPYLAHCVATGSPAFGMRVKRGGAWYLAAEDAHGLAWRAMALQRRHGAAPGFKLIRDVTAPHGNKSESWQALVAAVKTERPALIAIDTLAMTFPGIDENDAKSMGAVVDRCRALSRWGAAVVLIHHAPKTGDTPRGHSLLNAALDVALRLEPKDGDGIVRGQLTKNRNGSVDREFAFKIGVEMMGIDEDGDPITFALCEPLDGPAAFKRKVLSEREQFALELAIEHCAPDRSIDVAAWRERCIASGAMADSSDTKVHANGWRRIRDKLVKSGHLVENDVKIFVAFWVLAERENSLDADDDLIG